ncbi:hypothetical protein NM680_12880 [Paracoccus sp. PS-1]|uniref:hypothetical protein n=1 Tax=Paracoccus sp. PS1 TaxID=2963938 RepID=UPI0027E3B82B|nr:hypothetical protein [Paracoccus sp. PS1]MDQ7262686.1 hypothetical protein [Paracoccus sp. PS1]
MSENEGVNAISVFDPDNELICQIVATIPDSVQSFEFDRDQTNGYLARLRLIPSRQVQRRNTQAGKRGAA